jgi:hypothetical protein
MIVDDVIPIRVRQAKVRMSPLKKSKVQDAYNQGVLTLQNLHSPFANNSTFLQKGLKGEKEASPKIT